MTFVADLRTHDRTRRQYASDTIAGTQVRVARGVYASTPQWKCLGDTERYVALIHAIVRTRKSPAIVSHWSAAALHGLPMVGRWPSTVHLTVPASSGSRSRHRVTRHAMPLDLDEVVEVSGLRVTSLARTVIDIASLGHFQRAVTMADFVLHENRGALAAPRSTREILHAQWRRRMPFRGSARASEVIDFATAFADSALESVSRVNMELIGFPRPQLQVPFYDHLGLIGYADAFWPEFSLIGEADGDQKYVDPAVRGGRSIEEVLLAQTKRENRLRALGFAITRWDWTTASSLPRFRAHLLAAGLPTRR